MKLKKIIKQLQFWKLLTGLLLLINLGLIGLVVLFGQQRLSLLVNKTVTQWRQKASTAYHRLKQPQVEQLAINIPIDNWQQILTKREEALEKGVLLTNDDDFVKAELFYNDQTIPITLRLKGDWTDHLEGDKWSFRIHVKDGQSFKGMRYFSIQDPQTRMMVNEWLFFQALRRENLIALRYDFIDVSVNNQHQGIYAIEEHFSKELIENNQRREGPILKLSEDRVWELNLRYDFQEGMEEGQAHRSEIQPFKANKTLSTPLLQQQFVEAERLLREYRQEKIPASQVFDIDLWARLYALSDLFNVRHGLTTHNLRFYYNPVTGLLEPVAFDANIEKRIAELSIEADSVFKDFPGMMANRTFQEKYLQYLDKFSQRSYLDIMLEELDPELNKVVSLLNRDQYYQFSPRLLYLNQDFIRNKLTDLPAIHASLTEQYQLELHALIELPTKVLALLDTEGNIIKNFGTKPIYVPAVSKKQRPKIVTVELGSAAQSMDLTKLAEYQLSYQLIGLEKKHQVPLAPWPLSLSDRRLSSHNSSLPNFIQVDPAQHIYRIPTGKWQLNQDLVIPADNKLIVEANTKLDLINSAAIISHGPVFFQGEPEQSIIVGSSDKTGAGLLVLNAQQNSTINYTTFENLSYIQAESNNITGSITFYQSPVSINYSIFTNNSAEDLLNIIRSDFKISNSGFSNAFSDAFDADFSNGTIDHSQFYQSTNDAIDISGSQIEVNQVSIDLAGDKGISVGEVSRVTVIESEINNCNIAYASKDRSELTVRLGRINNCQLGYAVYQKKPEFGPARLVIWNTILENVTRQWIIEQQSVISYNGNDYTQKEKSVYQQLLKMVSDE